MTTSRPQAQEPLARFECSTGAVTLSRVAPLVVVVTMNGSLDAVVGKRIAGALTEVLEKASAPVRTFWDLEALERYHSDVRVLCTQALVRNWSHVAQMHAFAKNRVVKMGVAVANVALRGRLQSVATREEFDALLREATQ